jgi:predicted phage tail protein
VNEPSPTFPETRFSKGIDPMTDDEQQVARAFKTLSERLSKEIEDALNQMAHLVERAQKQQYEIMSISGKHAATMEALAGFVAKIRNDNVDRHNEHAAAIERLLQGQMKIAQFTDGLATQYGQLFKTLSSRLDAVEKEAFGPNYNQQPSTPPLN